MAYQALVATVLADADAAVRATSRQAGSRDSWRPRPPLGTYSRNLLLDSSTRHTDLPPEVAAELLPARQQLAGSIAAITAALDPADGHAAHYLRSASLFAHIADQLPEQDYTSPPQLALRDLQLLDGALAEAARWAGVPVTDLDTVGV